MRGVISRTGHHAVARKLIDHIGGLHEAVQRAETLAGCDVSAAVINLYRPSPSFSERSLLGGGVAEEKVTAAVLSSLAAGSWSETDPLSSGCGGEC